MNFQNVSINGFSNILSDHMGDGFFKLSTLWQDYGAGRNTLVGAARVSQGNHLAKLLYWVIYGRRFLCCCKMLGIHQRCIN